MKKFFSLVIGDFRNITRDSNLMVMSIAPLLIVIVMRFMIPFITDIIVERFDYNLEEHYLFITGFLSTVPAMLAGFVMGFLILDERDENIIQFFFVTPLSRRGYLFFKLSSGIFYCIFSYYLIALGLGLCRIDVVRTLPVAVMCALEAPLFALVLASFASNKVVGLALGKICGLIYIGYFIEYFVKSKYGILASITPTYWVSKSFNIAQNNGNLFLPVLFGFIVHILLIVFMVNRFGKRIG